MNPAGLPPIRISDLKRIGQSPAHYHANAGRVDAPWLDKGTGAHSALLGGRRVTYFDRVTESGRAAPRNGQHWDKFQAGNPDALILTRTEYDQVMGMNDSVRACPEAMRVLDGVKETTVTWDILGRPCRGTPDVRSDEYVTELKTCRTADPARFMWDAIKMGYLAQLAWYLDGIKAAGVGAPELAYVVAVESVAPYVVTVFRVTDRALDFGRRTYHGWLERLAVCEDADEWPGYVQCVVPLDIPDREDEPATKGEEVAA